MDVIISLSYQTRLWLSQISTSAGLSFIEKNKHTLFVDGRYFQDAQTNAQNTDVKLWTNEEIFRFCQAARYERIGIEQEYATFSEIEKIKAWFPSAKLIPISAQKMRIIKTTREIKLIRKAALIALQALEKLRPHIKAGVSEKELDAKLEFLLRQGGADKSSFDAIIASGPRSALPHGRASQRVLAEGEFVTIDFGALYQGYACDITRNFHVGKVTNPELLTNWKSSSRSAKPRYPSG
ncbi:Xaa-Pro peptidase family protein [Mycoplasma sp. ATU-Cv-508]|uniref:Xaa-Pro peptidase family protein n=1 Tax=Mycoplasma sp. ATU-Cv-508 TaxID=2048001 RepID=UPI0031F32591